MAPKGEVSNQRPRGRVPRLSVPMRGRRRVPGEAAPGDAAAARRGAAKRFGAPAAMRAGGGPRFAGRGVSGKDRGKARGGSRRPAAPGGDLPERGVDPAGIRSRLPRTGGRPGRCSGTGEAGIARRRGPPEFAAACSGRRPRRPRDAGSPEAPPGAFSARNDAEAIEKNSPRRTDDAREQVT